MIASAAVAGVKECIQALLERLNRLGRAEALGLVRPPLAADSTRSTLEAAGVAAVSPVLDWFGEWDGQSASGTLGTMDVLPGFYALSLQDALAHRASQSSWPTSWLPLLADGGGDFYVVNTVDEAAPVLRYRHDDSTGQVVATSLAAFLRAALRAFEEGVVFVQDGFLEQDDEAWAELLGQRG